MSNRNTRQPIPRPISTRRLDITSLICEVSSTYSDTFDERDIDVDLDIPQSLWVDLDPVLMRDVFRKLIDNAVEAMPNGGSLVVTSLIGRNGLEIEFADSGRTISEELKDRLFEPFSTTKHGHAGLGLSMVRDIIESHHGKISVDDCPEGGTAFTLSFPIGGVKRQAA